MAQRGTKSVRSSKKNSRSDFLKTYLPKSDVDRVKREAAKKRISASVYVGQIVLEHLALVAERDLEAK